MSILHPQLTRHSAFNWNENMNGKNFIQYDPLTEVKVKRHTWLTEQQAAKYLNVSASMLAKNRCYKRGLELIPFVKLSSRCIRYDKLQLDTWLEAQLQAFNEEQEK
tara:strand:+ start:2027 stop:2344 length:318 start_codon:yes stop_codon:yes gene_type:complete